jgi:predicted DNA-binding transcriptional regulator YafY
LIDEKQQMIKVRFGEEIGHLIRERVWHPSQKLVEEEGGNLTLNFEASGEKEILAWLYSYLPHVQVLEPEGFREIFYQSLRDGLSVVGQT